LDDSCRKVRSSDKISFCEDFNEVFVVDDLSTGPRFLFVIETSPRSPNAVTPVPEAKS
jgi:hypothetical protein